MRDIVHNAERVGRSAPAGAGLAGAAALAVGLAMAAGGVQARADLGASRAPDPTLGEALSVACEACHGARGISAKPQIPHLAGQHAGYLANAIRAYKTGERVNESMNGIVASLTEQDMQDLAAFYAGLPPFRTAAAAHGGGPAPADDVDPFAATREATLECAACHGEDGNITEPGMPALAGQPPAYLVAALASYKGGARAEPMMASFVEPLDQRAIEDIAYFYAASRPEPAAAPAVGDPFAGRAPAAKCAGCHGEDGNSPDPKMPRLAGLDAEYIVTAIKAYEDGAREHSVMREAVAGLLESEIRDLAAFYAASTPRTQPIRKPLTAGEWAKRCDRCHGADGISKDPRFPILAGQSQAYLVRALKEYHGAERPSTMMQAMSFPMGEGDIERIAAYYARRGR